MVVMVTTEVVGGRSCAGRSFSGDPYDVRRAPPRKALARSLWTTRALWMDSYTRTSASGLPGVTNRDGER